MTIGDPGYIAHYAVEGGAAYFQLEAGTLIAHDDTHVSVRVRRCWGREKVITAPKCCWSDSRVEAVRNALKGYVENCPKVAHFLPLHIYS